jgi:hypothetical protein
MSREFQLETESISVEDTRQFQILLELLDQEEGDVAAPRHGDFFICGF